MPNYIEYIQIGAGGEAFPVRDVEAHASLNNLPNLYAPAGYGSNGDNIPNKGSFTSESALNDLFTAELNTMSNESRKTLRASLSFAGLDGDYTINLHKPFDGYAYADACTYDRTFLQFACRNNVWQPMEWVNPPMIPETEYRTIERYNGNPVYTKVINCGTLDAGTWKTHEFTGASGGVIRYSGMSAGTAIPFNPLPVADPNNNIQLGVIPGTIYISKGSTTTVNGDIYVQVWYIK